jgi:hypothetical protein
VTQLTVKLYHLNPRRKKDQKKIKWKTPKLLKRIWKCSRKLQTTEESGRVREALGVSGPSRKEERDMPIEPGRQLGALRKQGNRRLNRRLPRPQTPGRQTTTAVT